MVSDQIYSGGGGGHRDFRGYRAQNSRLIFGLKLKSHILIWASVAVLGFPIFASLLDRRPPMNFVSATGVPDSTAPGSRVTAYYKGEYVRNDACTMEVNRTWIDSSGIEWELAPVRIRYGKGPQTVGLTTNIPMDAASGPIRLESRMKWSCNEIQQIVRPGQMDMPDLTVTVVR